MQRYGNYIYVNGKGKARIKKSKEMKTLKTCEKLRNKIDNSSLTESVKFCGHGHINMAENRAKDNLKRYRPKETLKSFKKIPHDKLKSIIVAYINNTEKSYVTKEEISIKYNVKQHYVEEIFKELNREGILYQRKSNYAHDTNRNPMFYGSESGWACDTYDIGKRSYEIIN